MLVLAVLHPDPWRETDCRPGDQRSRASHRGFGAAAYTDLIVETVAKVESATL